MAPICWPRRVAAAVLLLAPPLALAQAATVDQVLAAIGSVVRDRAKQVASRTLATNLTKHLCEGTVTLPFDPPDAPSLAAPAAGAALSTNAAAAPAASAGDGSAPSGLTLFLGGDEACRATYLPGAGGARARSAAATPGTPGTACGPDDVFIRTCRLAKRLDVPLTDAYFLKSLSRDAVEFLMRVGGRELPEDVYARSGLVEVGAFIHAVLEQLGHRKPNPRELADPTLALADLVTSDLRPATFEKLVASGEAAALEKVLKEAVVAPWVKAGCPPYPAAAKNGGAGACKLEWYDGASCEKHEASSRGRDAVFDAIFGKRGAPGPLHAGRDAVCGEAFASNEVSRTQCRQARLTVNLHGSLVRGRCATERAPERLRSAFRELVYVVGEQRVYRDALTALAGEQGGAALRALDGFLDAVQRLDLSDLPREELSAGFRLVGTYAAAADLAPEDTRRWLRLLARDLQAEGGDLGEDSYARLLHGEALGTDTRLAAQPVAALQAAAKDLLVLPALAVVRYQRNLDQAADARRALEGLLRKARGSMRSLLQAVERDPASSGAFREYVGALSAFLSDLAAVTAALGDALEDGPAPAGLAPKDQVNPPPKRQEKPLAQRTRGFRHGALAMKNGALALQLAAERDWVGLAVQLSDEVTRLPGAEGKLPELERSLRFVRILLSMYQAPTVEEAKAIFASNLDDVASRERRYPGPRWTVDVAALVGFTGGGLVAWEALPGQEERQSAALYGIYAPVGVQFARGPFGVIGYPVDVGSYLTSTDAAGDPGRDWRDGFRAGLAAYWRPWATIPVVFGGGSDYRFKLDGREEWRWFGTASLELPLFMIR